MSIPDCVLWEYFFKNLLMNGNKANNSSWLCFIVVSKGGFYFFTVLQNK